jgi:uncharacterized membrane protein YhaH (DUF805 family)
MRRRIAGSLPTAAAVTFVLAAYAFFASAGTFEFRRVSWDWTLYNALVEGFLGGKSSMPHTPDPALLGLADPYDPALRDQVEVLWDASLYDGKYYLYFSPVPALLFHLPFRLVARGYPSDALAAAFFCAWAFLAACAFVARALRDSRWKPLWFLLLGLGHVVPFLLLEVRVYEVAIACAMAMSATWAYTLLRFVEQPSSRAALLMGVFLALSIATRPNLIVLIPVAAVAIVMLRDRRRIVAAAIAAAVPVIVAGSTYAAYNYARFGSPFETGLTYQLTVTSMRGETPCRFSSRADCARFFNTAMHYVFLPPKFVSPFPFVEMKFNDVEPRVSFPATPEEMAGFAPVTPLAMLGSALGVLLLLARRARDDGTRAAMLVLAAGWIVLLTLSTCRWVTARYSLDFYLLLLAGSIVALERGLTFLGEAGVALRPLRAFVAALAVYSIVVGTLLGFAGPRGAFERENPRLFRAITRALR